MATKPDSMIEEQVVATDGAKTSDKASPDASTAESNESAEESAALDVVPTVEELLELAMRDLAALEDRFLRQAADFQNFRKRALEERAFSVEIGKSQVALPIVDVLDDLRRSVEASEPASPVPTDALRDGVKLVYEKFAAELAKLGISPMEVVGQQFDENRHEAMMQQPAAEGVEPGTVVAEIQKGYMIGERVLRHARVVVAS
jgi:molecular chaperone GrpE